MTAASAAKDNESPIIWEPCDCLQSAKNASGVCTECGGLGKRYYYVKGQKPGGLRK